MQGQGRLSQGQRPCSVVSVNKYACKFIVPEVKSSLISKLKCIRICESVHS